MGSPAMNKRTVALTTDQYKSIISTIKKGFLNHRPNERIATALMPEANLGLRISDILKLRLSDIIKDGGRYRLAIVEQKTGKARNFTVPLALFQFIRCYCLDNGIAADERIFPVSERAVQKLLGQVCDYLGIQGIGTHSFRKFYATEIYKDSGYNILLVQQLLQHSRPVGFTSLHWHPAERNRNRHRRTSQIRCLGCYAKRPAFYSGPFLRHSPCDQVRKLLTLSLYFSMSK